MNNHNNMDSFGDDEAEILLYNTVNRSSNNLTLNTLNPRVPTQETPSPKQQTVVTAPPPSIIYGRERRSSNSGEAMVPSVNNPHPRVQMTAADMNDNNTTPQQQEQTEVTSLSRSRRQRKGEVLFELIDRKNRRQYPMAVATQSNVHLRVPMKENHPNSSPSPPGATSTATAGMQSSRDSHFVTQRDDGTDDTEQIHPCESEAESFNDDSVSTHNGDKGMAVAAASIAAAAPRVSLRQSQPFGLGPLELARVSTSNANAENPMLATSRSSLSHTTIERFDTDFSSEDDAVEFQQQDTLKNNRDLQFGEADVDEDDYRDATWNEVCQACCCHTPVQWFWISIGLLTVSTFLYFFLFGLELMARSAKVMSGCKAGEMFGADENPVAGVMVGLLATVMLQSSSATTSIIVSLVGNEHGTGSITVAQGIYMVMGANVGTSVTNTIVATFFSGNGDQLERAFAGATVHDMFNYMSLAVLFPLELMTKLLERLTGAITRNLSTKDDAHWQGPVKQLVSPLVRRIIIPNTKAVEEVAAGAKTCEEFYPMSCPNGPTYKSCGGKFGLIACDKNRNFCPVFFSVDATVEEDKVNGGVVFVLAILILFFCLGCLIASLQKLLLGVSTRIVYKATNVNGYMAILLGTGITMLVQSSSITTSTLTPLMGIGVLQMDQMYPLTLGANLGTCFTALMAAMVSDNIEALQVALAHTFFNVFGIFIWYPIPFMRNIPRHAAVQLGRATRLWRGFTIFYISIAFVLGPLLLLGLSALFNKGAKGFKVLGAFLVICLSILLLFFLYWCRYSNGREVIANCFIARERKRIALEDLPDTLDYMLEKINALIEHTGLPDDHEEDCGDDSSRWTSAHDSDGDEQETKPLTNGTDTGGLRHLVAM